MGSSPLTKKDGSYNGAMAIVYDVTERKRKEVLLLAQKNIFEILTNEGSLKLALSELVLGIEQLIDGVHASILILHEDGERLFTGAAPHLPLPYSEAIHGIRIGPNVGSCGTSAFTKKTVIVSDIATDPLWKDFKDLPIQFGYKACWSTPIMDGKVLGTFALYFKENREPTEIELKIISDFTSAARLSIQYINTREKENKLRSHALLLSECRKAVAETLEYKKVLKKNPEILTDGFADWGFITMLKPEGYLELFGSSSVPEKKDLIKKLDHYRPQMEAKHGLPQAIREKRAILFSEVSEDDLLPDEDGWPKFGTREPAVIEVVKQLGYKSVIFAPMIVRGNAIGGITIVSSQIEKRFNQNDLDFVSDVAQSCAIAIDNSILYSESQQSVQAREDFISVASHELRTPLTSLKLRLDLLTLKMKKGGLPLEFLEKLEPVISQIHPDVEKFSKLVETLLDISKLRSKKLYLNLEPCNLSEVISSEVYRLKESFDSQKCELKIDIEANIKGSCDDLRLQQVVSNLLSNALKFGKNRLVEFSARARENLLIIHVKDHGIGISPEDVERVFKPFERAVSEKNFGGLGLGLYIAQEIVSGHGGSIRVDGRPGEGTSFTVELPIYAKP